MINRRQWLGLTAGAGAALALEPRLLWAAGQDIITRAVPSTGERLPIVGLGSSATFRQVADSADASALRGVFRTMVERGGRVFDTAPSYGASEEVAGRIAREESLTDRIFWATKMNGVQGPAGTLDPAIAQKQMESSLQRLAKRPLDLIQVHGLASAKTQIGMLKEMKQSGQIRYIGVTTTSAQQYEQLQQLMRAEPLDFIGIDYAVDNRDIEEHILPLAQDRGIGGGRGRWRRERQAARSFRHRRKPAEQGSRQGSRRQRARRTTTALGCGVLLGTGSQESAGRSPGNVARSRVPAGSRQPARSQRTHRGHCRATGRRALGPAGGRRARSEAGEVRSDDRYGRRISGTAGNDGPLLCAGLGRTPGGGQPLGQHAWDGQLREGGFVEQAKQEQCKPGQQPRVARTQRRWRP